MPPESLLEPLSRCVEEAGRLAQRARETLSHELKADGSIVSVADREVEIFLRDALPKLVSGCGFWGEEFGFEPEGPEGLWAADPVDGTSNYVFGSPLWGISVALLRRGEIELGCVVLPDLQETYVSARGGGVARNGLPLAPIPAGPIRRQELVSLNDTAAKALGSVRPPGRRRDIGAFVISGTFVLMQRFRGLIGIREKLYDCAPCILMARELGADVRFADGSELIVADHVRDKPIGKPWVIFPRDSGFLLR